MKALWSEGARERMGHVLADHKLHNLTPVNSWPEAMALPEGSGVLTPRGRFVFDPTFEYSRSSSNRLVFRGVEIVT